MDADRWQRVDDLFQAAIARAGEERRAFLNEACAGDDGLRHELDRLVRAHERSRGFLEIPIAAEALRILAAAEDQSSVQSTLTAFRTGTAFRGTDRFAVRRQLGAGGMGVVYEVHDRVRGEVVALKTFLRARAADIYRLKREFRSLADVAHPNLVSLYELVVEGADCFFTMELVHGVNLVEYVRAPTATPAIRAERVRHVFRQLVEGIGALHRRGKLHRDIKPSNILVTPDGRVVILDFGLASDVVPDDAAAGESLAGTPAYLAPERRPGVLPSEGHDWYSVGVTLYEALTGRLTFDGSLEDVLRRKREADPCPPAEIAPDVPDDLNALCIGLLRRDPVQRMSVQQAAQILQRDSVSSGEAHPPPADKEPPFVGRHWQLDGLETALRKVKLGTAAAIYVHGPSGIGKSALIQCFLDRVLSREPVVVLRGRCYEYESVPFKALDGVIDSLSQLLSSLPRSQSDPLLPPDLMALLRLFPVMQRVEASASIRRSEQQHTDPLVLRQRAFTALRELLTRLAARQPLVVYIDDLHWADADSAVLLEELLRPPQAPPILTIACLRTEEIASKPFLQALLERTGSKAGTGLPLEPMTDDEARALLAFALGVGVSVGGETLLQIAREAGGNPFLLRQLAGYLAADPTRGHRVTFAEMLDERVRALPREGQRFLETLAICGRPMAPDLVCDACGASIEKQSLVAMLRASHFIRSSGSSERVETYHDRIREALAAQMAPGAVRQIHALMVQALVARGSDDCEALYAHYRGAGDHMGASTQAALAARKAVAALAFDRAASFYRCAIELAPDSPVRFEWKQGLAGALANAGRSTEAADVYLDAAGGADQTRRVELQRRAAEQMLIGGHIDRGLDIARAVLREVGIRLATTPHMALASFLVRRAQLRWRGLEFVRRDVDRIPSEDLLRIDTCWSVTTGLTLVDSIRAADFHTRHLLLALDAGDMYRIARGMALEVGFSAVIGGPNMRRTLKLIERAHAMAERVGHPHAIALSTLAAGMAAYLVGQWSKATLLCERALVILRDQCVGVTWELNCAQNFLLGSLLYEGKLHEVSRQLPILLANAREHGNLYFETELRTRMTLVWLAANHPDEGEQQANDVMKRWSHEGFHRQHYNHVLARVQTELYRGRAQPAWQLIAENWAAIKRSHLLRVQWARIEAAYVRGRCALLMVANGRDARGFLSVARGEVRRIEREKMPWSDPLGLLMSAAVAYLEGDAEAAECRLVGALDGFDRAKMKLYAAVARRRLGTLMNDDGGRELVRRAEDWMASQDIKEPALMTQLIAPGFP